MADDRNRHESDDWLEAEEAFRRRNYDFAVEVYQQLLEIDPDLAEARSGLRRALKKGDGAHELTSGDETLILDLNKVIFIRIDSNESKVGF